MKQVLQFRRSGQTRVVDVPAPLVPDGGLLVRNAWSLISPGTERMLTEAGGNLGLLNTARKRPDLVRQVVDKARNDGISATLEAVRSRIDVAVPLGYSCAGTVLGVGAATDGFAVGDRVACAGAGQANHAEVVAVPKRLVTLIPDGVDDADAAFVTVGAIALQGIRIADVRLGESCVVIGLGLVGQLTVQLLKAAGCRVFGIDLDPHKIDLALAIGADGACARSDPRLVERIRTEFSGGRGADAILITAASGSSDPIQLAANLARDRAVVVAVGMVGMDVPRNAYYEKELQLRLSRSYGPGRYDPTYEVDGVDYPIGYVRWTEQRNMAAFLDLVAQGKVQPSRLVTHRIPVADAERAYQIVSGQVPEPFTGILLEYPEVHEVSTRIDLTPASTPPALDRTTVRLGLIGAGNFARSVLLPRLQKLDVQLRGVATASGPSAQQTGARFGFGYATTDWRQVVDDPSVDAVLIATRHDLHATVAAAALRNGKSVFLEKPMALAEPELEDLLEAWRASERVLMVGFNRRFAPTYQQLASAFAGRRRPLVMNYRVNAGAVARGSWVLDPLQGGGRLIGEACHMLDLMCHLARSSIATVHVQPLASNDANADDFVLTLTLGDGSIGSLSYASGGDRSMPKERLEVLGDGRAAVLDDFRSLELFDGGRKHGRGAGLTGRQDKGHAAELAAFVAAVREGKLSPIDPVDAAHITRATFAAVESARTGSSVHL